MKSRVLVLFISTPPISTPPKEFPFALEHMTCVVSPAVFHWKRVQPTHLSPSVVDQFHRPSPFILNPHKYPSICITRGQLLVWLIPPYQHNLENNQDDIYHKE